MNPLTQVKRIQSINAKEAELGISDNASWHAKYKDSAYVYAGGLSFDLTEGDLLAVFAQYGEVVDLNLVRDKATGKSKGFAFVAYEDQRSTNLAVDNLGGAVVSGRTIRVDHVDKYKKKEEEDEEEEQRKREERGVCRAFQRGECTRGAACRFSHNEQRAANTGWGAEDKKWGHDNYDGPRKKNEEGDEEEKEKRGVCRDFQRGVCTRGAGCKFSHNEQRAANTGWGAEDKKRGHDNYDGPRKSDKRYGSIPSNRVQEPRVREDLSTNDEFKKVPDRRALDEEKRSSRRRGEDVEPRREDYGRREEKRSRRHEEYERQPRGREYNDRREDSKSRRQGEDELEPKPESGEDKRHRRHGDDAAFEPKSREDQVRTNYDRRVDRRPRKRDDLEAHDMREDRDRMEEKRLRRPSHDALEPKSRASHDRREGERLRRHPDDEVPPKPREGRQKGD
ncbi:zinc finger CCCH domain-containing protein 42 isoform X1 [Argentina anserina]|uniref:zinc finger CCCH domain-containing protein 42 isoform X1 n=1 Tax=Argentina anserina TaxID=57926 RepID=UPI0021766FEA|nr:zinc finger CCCH domain-containing protein 42 isoform X1 [Potentilla anserina]